MKKLIIILPILFIVTLVFPNNLSLFTSTQKVAKEINLSIFTENNYRFAAYDGQQATIEVTISKIKNNQQVILRKEVFTPLQLKQFPTVANAINAKLNVNDVMNRNETLLVTYRVSYNSKGSVIVLENNEVVNKETGKDNISIKI